MPSSPRSCTVCGQALGQRDGERKDAFARRKTCGSKSCVAAARKVGIARAAGTPAREQAKEAAWLERLADIEAARGSHDFEMSDLVLAARRAAPTVPAHILADVLREVEPLIAANVRFALLGAFADAARPFLPSWVPPEERLGEKVS